MSSSRFSPPERPSQNRLAWFFVTLLAGGVLAVGLGLVFRSWLAQNIAQAAQPDPVAVERVLPAPQVVVDTPASASPPTLSVSGMTGVSSLSINGIDMSVAQPRRDGKRIKFDVCYTLPDNADWVVWQASLYYPGGEGEQLMVEMRDRHPATAGQPGRRCDVVSFRVPPEANTSQVTFTIQSIGAYPSESDYCTTYLSRVQAGLAANHTGVQVACATENGSASLVVVGKPAQMTQAEAEKLVQSDVWFTIQGPWVFTASVQP